MDQNDIKRRIRELREKIANEDGGASVNEKIVKLLGLDEEAGCHFTNLIDVAKGLSEVFQDIKHLSDVHDDAPATRLALAIVEFVDHVNDQMMRLGKKFVKELPQFAATILEKNHEERDVFVKQVCERIVYRRELALPLDVILGMIVAKTGNVVIDLNGDLPPPAVYSYDPLKNTVDIAATTS